MNRAATMPFKKTTDGRITKKAHKVLVALDGYLAGRTTMPDRLVISEEAYEDLINPNYDGVPTYRDIPIESRS